MEERNKKEIADQVANYHTLGFFKSARGIATWLLCFYLIVAAINTAQGNRSVMDLIIYMIVYGILAFLVYKGNKWAMIFAMFVWTADRIYMFLQTNNWLELLLWFLITVALLKAASVENARRKLIKTEQQP